MAYVIYNIFENSDKKINAKKINGRDGTFGTFLCNIIKNFNEKANATRDKI